MANEGKSNRGVWLATAMLAVLAIGGFFGWRNYSERQAPIAPVVATPPPQPVVVDPATVNLADGDALLKAAAGELSTEEILAKWLAEVDLVRRLVGATFQVSRGESPRELLKFLGPLAEFSVDEVEDKTQPAAKVNPKRKVARKKGKAKKPSKHLIRYYLSAESTGRYDVIARVLGSIDSTRLGTLYAKLAPFAEMALREAAPPGKKLEEVFGAAVAHLEQAPLTDGKIELLPTEKGVDYAFADPKLEALTPAQKHLLRMGPANARLVLKKLQEFRAAAFQQRGDAGP